MHHVGWWEHGPLQVLQYTTRPPTVMRKPAPLTFESVALQHWHSPGQRSLRQSAFPAALDAQTFVRRLHSLPSCAMPARRIPVARAVAARATEALPSHDVVVFMMNLGSLYWVCVAWAAGGDLLAIRHPMFGTARPVPVSVSRTSESSIWRPGHSVRSSPNPARPWAGATPFARCPMTAAATTAGAPPPEAGTIQLGRK